MSFFTVREIKRDPNLVEVVFGGDICISYRYSPLDNRVLEVSIEVPPSAARDGVSNERFVGKVRLAKARRAAQRHFLEKKVSVARGTTTEEVRREQDHEAKAAILSKWFKRKLTPIELTRISNKLLRVHLHEFVAEHSAWSMSVDELLSMYRSVRGKKSADSKVRNERKKLVAHEREEKRKAREAEAAKQYELPLF